MATLAFSEYFLSCSESMSQNEFRTFEKSSFSAKKKMQTSFSMMDPNSPNPVLLYELRRSSTSYFMKIKKSTHSAHKIGILRKMFLFNNSKRPFRLNVPLRSRSNSMNKRFCSDGYNIHATNRSCNCTSHLIHVAVVDVSGRRKYFFTSGRFRRTN